MKHRQIETDKRIKSKTMGGAHYILTYVTMLLLVGIQVGIIVFPGFANLNKILQISIVMGYWALVATVFGVITNYQIKERYDKPMRKLSKAAKKVASGDFSVYLEPHNTADRYDYIDVLYLDFNIMVKELGSIETLKNDFISNVSHEIKTPLAVIKNQGTMIKSEHLPLEKRAEYAASIVKATDNLSLLISNILKLNKLENQEIETAPERYNLSRQLSDCVLMVETLWDEKDIDLQVDIEEKILIMADENMLEIVWNNLLSNALKFTPQGGRISLVQVSDVGSITVSVSDTGCGMDEITMRHIFDKFYQADSSRASEGNGLGLALAHRVVERLGGTLAVISEVGSGSTFTVTLPISMRHKTI